MQKNVSKTAFSLSKFYVFLTFYLFYEDVDAVFYISIVRVKV